MDQKDRKSGPMAPRTMVERTSDRETVVTRTFNAPAHILFEAWTKPDLFRRWWAPRSFGLNLLSCEMDVRVGGRYRLEFGHPASEQPMAFFGSYTEVAPDARLVWTNDESNEGPITAVTFEAQDGVTTLVVRNIYPTKEALERDGSTDAMGETLDQLDELVTTLLT